MKKTLLLLLIPALMQAQTTLYQNDFTSGGSGWTLQQGNALNTWIVNNVYNCTYPTPNQGGGNYMHVYDDLFGDFCATYVIAGMGSGETVFATLNSGINTVGQPQVTIQFDWLCLGQTGPLLASFGHVEYSTDNGNTWTQFTNPIWQYNGQSTWTTTTISSANEPGILNQPSLRLRFGFTSSGYGQNPSFAIDDLLITGSLSTATQEIALPEPVLFPNPNPGSFSVDMSGISGDHMVEVVNALGQTVFQASITGGSILPIELSNPAPGIHTLKVCNEKQSFSRRFVVF